MRMHIVPVLILISVLTLIVLIVIKSSVNAGPWSVVLAFIIFFVSLYWCVSYLSEDDD
jgi:Flp pilus assembly protein TadB